MAFAERLSNAVGLSAAAKTSPNVIVLKARRVPLRVSLLPFNSATRRLHHACVLIVISLLPFESSAHSCYRGRDANHSPRFTMSRGCFLKAARASRVDQAAFKPSVKVASTIPHCTA